MIPHPASPPTAARDLFAGLLPVDERVLGPEHPRTLADRANLAGFTREAGDPATARDLFAGLLPVAPAGYRPAAPRHAGRPRQPRLLDRAGGRRL